MEETVFYISSGNPKDKQSLESFALATSTRTSHQHASFRNADCPRNGAVLTGVGAGERVFTTATNKALLNIYTWGKESPDQKIPVPEQLSCLALVPHPEPSIVHRSDTLHKLPSFRIPWLLAAGSKSGKLYIWELASGNLLCVKESHYQEVSTLQFSSCGTFIISGGLDARIIIWRTLDLISLYNGSDEDASIKPFHTITDNSLPITDLKISQSNNLNDLKLYTASRDGTLRVYDLFTKQLLTTFVLSNPIECLGKDPANRSLYVGLDNGTIRSIPLYRLNKNTSVLESIGGNSKIITLENDPELKETFVHHQQSVVTAGEETQVSVTKLDVSFDGMNIISGDSLGRVYVSDIVTKQILKSFNVCSGPISYIQVSAVTEDLNNQGTAGRNDKKHRLIPQLKRVLASTDAVEHQLYLEIPGPIVSDVTEDFDAWILAKSNEEFEFRNLSSIKSTVKKVTPIADNSKVADLQEKLDKVSQAYTELRMKHEELFNEHNKLLHSS